MFDIGTTAVLLDAAQDLNEALQGSGAGADWAQLSKE